MRTRCVVRVKEIDLFRVGLNVPSWAVGGCVPYITGLDIFEDFLIHLLGSEN